MSINHLITGQAYDEIIVNKAIYEAMWVVVEAAECVAGEMTAFRADCLDALNDALDRLEAVE